jgi:hypothetical protein
MVANNEERSAVVGFRKTHFLYVVGVIDLSRRDLEDKVIQDLEPQVEGWESSCLTLS